MVLSNFTIRNWNFLEQKTEGDNYIPLTDKTYSFGLVIEPSLIEEKINSIK